MTTARRHFRSPLIALLSLLCLLLAAVPVAQATTPDKIQAAGERMRDHGLAKGVDASGDLALGANITRAQLVTIIVRAFGFDKEAQALNGQPAFPDTANHPWASGYIALAKRLIEERSNGAEVVGRPDGTFNPDGNVTAAESVAFLMKFLGVKSDPTLGWPANYIQGALKAGLITAEDQKNLTSIQNTPATRGLVFYLADRAFSTYELPEGGTVYTKYVDPKPSTPAAAAPTVYIALPEPGSVFMSPHNIKVSGTYTAPGGLHSLQINGQEAQVHDGKFEATVNLHEDGIIEAVITDNAGQTAMDSIYMTPGPHPAMLDLTVSNVSPKPGETVTITVKLNDAFGRPLKAAGHQIKWFTSTSASGQATDNNDGTYTAQFTVPESGTIFIYVDFNGMPTPASATLTIK